MEGLIGKKIGMTRIFSEETGRAIPATIVQLGANIVHQVKTVENDGYSAAQLGFGILPERKVSRPKAGHFAKHGTEATRVVSEFKMDAADEVAPGQTIGVEMFDDVKYVDVVGTTKGRGYSGTIKRHNFHRGRETHGNTNRRDRGSLGAGTYPARVFPGVKMAGQYGNERVTIKGIEIVGSDKDAGLVYLKGAIPGAKKGIVFLKKNTTKK